MIDSHNRHRGANEIRCDRIQATNKGDLLFILPAELYKAASADGADKWPQFWRITFPMLTPFLIFMQIQFLRGRR